MPRFLLTTARARAAFRARLDLALGCTAARVVACLRAPPATCGHAVGGYGYAPALSSPSRCFDYAHEHEHEHAYA